MKTEYFMWGEGEGEEKRERPKPAAIDACLIRCIISTPSSAMSLFMS